MHYIFAIWMAVFSLFSVSVCAQQKSELNQASFANGESGILLFTEQERDWMNENRTVTVIGDAAWLPFEGFTRDGDYVGIVADILNLISEKSELNFTVSKTASWRHSVQFSENQLVDIISASASNPLLEKNYRATYSTVKSPVVIVARDAMGYVPDLAAAKGVRVAIIGATGYGNKVKKSFPEIDFIEVEQVSDGLLGIAEDRYDLMLMTMTEASYQMAELGLYDLRVVGITALEMELTLFVNRNKPILWDIIEKVKRHETKQERHKIISKWAKYNYEERYSSEIIRIFLLLALFLSAFILYRNYLLKTQKQLFSKLSKMDKLTRVYNRIYLDQIISEQLQVSRSKGNTVSLILVDIDNFKQVNVKYGYLIADKLLQQFSLLIEESMGRKAFIGRWGAAQFVIVCPNKNLQEASRVAEKLRLEIFQAIFLNVGKKTACLGVVEYQVTESQTDCLARLAKALCYAKQAGPNQLKSEA